MNLHKFFLENPRAALAFSGGTDSAYLLWAAREAGAQVQPYFIKSEFQPAFELEDARRLCGQLGIELKIINLRQLGCPEIASNPPERCYHCKRRLFTALLKAAAGDGYSLVIDGTNASDSASDRPGMRAIRELGVRSPLREAGITKAQVRELSARAGLFTWSKPSYACLATRIATGTPIREEDLKKVEQGEAALAALGYRNFRLRMRDWGALLQFDVDQLADAEANLESIRALLGDGFGEIRIDPVGRKGD